MSTTTADINRAWWSQDAQLRCPDHGPGMVLRDQFGVVRCGAYQCEWQGSAGTSEGPTFFDS